MTDNKINETENTKNHSSLEHILSVLENFTRLKNIRIKETLRKEIKYFIQHLDRSYGQISEENASKSSQLETLTNDYLSVTEQLNEAKAMLKHNKEVMADLRHDLTNSIGVLTEVAKLTSKEYKDLLSQNPAIEGTEFNKWFNMENDVVHGTYALVKKYAEWSRTNLDKDDSTNKYYSVNDLLMETYNLVKPMVQVKNISLKLSDLEATKDLKLYGNELKISIILNNLIHNSLKFTPSGSSIKISAKSQDDNYIKLSVEDEGVGIPNDKWDTIFSDDANEQFTTMGTNEEKGTGRGSKICYRLVNSQGGKIWVDSYETQKIGTKISFTVPKHSPDEMIKKYSSQ